MNTWRKLWLSVIATAMIASILPAQAEVTWDQVKQKITSAKDYSVTYKYHGPKGQYDFDYRWGGPDHIRTEITGSKSDSSKKGTVILYDKGWKADQVRAKTGGGVITRNLTHKDVVGTPFATSLFGMILDQTKALGKPKVSAQGGKTQFKFGKDYTVWANDKAEIVKTERKDGNSDETREFLTHRWNSSPATGF
jgi:hypothetical protein